MEKHPLKPKWEIPVDWINWSAGVGRPAGVYLLDGSYHIAAYSTAADQALVERGALLVATLRFDRDPLESSHPGRAVEPLHPRAAMLRFADPRTS